MNVKRLVQVNITGTEGPSILPTATRSDDTNNVEDTILLIIPFLIFFSPIIICVICVVYSCLCGSDATSANSPTVAVSDAPSARSAAVAATDPKRGLDPSVIKSLPLVKCGSAAEVCPICLTQFGLDEDVKLIPRCGHVFHPPCIDTWLFSNKTCPMCRSNQMFGGADVEMGFCSRASVQLVNISRN